MRAWIIAVIVVMTVAGFAVVSIGRSKGLDDATAPVTSDSANYIDKAI
jgi:hypothetical protein